MARSSPDNRPMARSSRSAAAVSASWSPDPLDSDSPPSTSPLMGISRTIRRRRSRTAVRQVFTTIRPNHAGNRSASTKPGSPLQARTKIACVASRASASLPRIAIAVRKVAPRRSSTISAKASWFPFRACSTRARSRVPGDAVASPKPASEARSDWLMKNMTPRTGTWLIVHAGCAASGKDGAALRELAVGQCEAACREGTPLRARPADHERLSIRVMPPRRWDVGSAVRTWRTGPALSADDASPSGSAPSRCRVPGERVKRFGFRAPESVRGATPEFRRTAGTWAGRRVCPGPRFGRAP